ncbi:hypothetical protein PHYSODRAFT_298879 [Phytophthora sojae]|uniref:Uncharacterized protein n=1 Tax=Phytophthora sojae (strain P6497) TaxID=1094619 RepID=G4Z632_PHYSP|nr:hypothetical protein PHYSODRAFT_298879 [Phytophthora sojae]EGZ20953.1 hypothetical protein PHYSODRAFT_298879 [Phytophthora sojae]|eukprot:XP_009523670.1 hypothetical protein PHYSODRAFT_298879 [Phytophthora sojae]
MERHEVVRYERWDSAKKKRRGDTYHSNVNRKDQARIAAGRDLHTVPDGVSRSWGVMERDRRSPGGQTSMDIQLTWLTTPGNYERWHNEVKGRLAKEIVVAMLAVGISRSANAVSHKIRGLETQFSSATAYLRGLDGRRDQVARGALELETQAQVDRLCPHFFELLPVLEPFIPVVGSVSVETTTNARGSTRKRESDVRAAEAARAAKRRHQRPAPEVTALSAEDNLELATNAASSDAAQYTATTTQDVPQVKREWRVVDRVAEPQLTPAFQQRMDECVLSHAEQRSQGILNAEERARECSIDAERYRTEAERHRTDAERRKSDIDVMLAKVLARQTMKDRGVATDEIEMALALHEP